MNIDTRAMPIDLLAVLFDPEDDLIELRALPSAHHAFIKQGDLLGVQRFVDKYAATENVYQGIASRKDASSGRLENCSSLRALWSEIDFKHFPSPEAARLRLDSFPMKPSRIIHSGGGLHCYWRLNDRVNLHPENNELVKDLLCRLAQGVGGDMASAEPARILRVTGTPNHKYDHHPIVEVVERNEVCYDLQDFFWLPEIPETQPPPIPKPNGKDPNATRPGDDFAAKMTWREILEIWGGQLSYYRGDIEYWTRPGKKPQDGHSATVNHDGHDQLYVFTSCWPPFEANTGYSKFTAYTLLNHGGDFRAAAKELAGLGFGAPKLNGDANHSGVDDGEPKSKASDSESQPKARPWVDIQIEENDESVVVGPGRWLTRGSGCLLVGPTGAGKSTLCCTLAFTWGLGRNCLGFHPVRPLKSLIVQAEDDDGDLADMRGGVLSVIKPTEAEREILRNSVLVVTERARTGVGFLRSFVLPLLKELSPDILWLNPLSAYFGADLNSQEAVALFFRNTLNPILAEAHCLAIIPHHIAKPSKERKDWTGGELAYLGAGSADLANWAREIIALRATAPGLFEMACTKRGRKLDWYDSDGKRTNVRMIAHGTNGQMVWRDADAETLSEHGAALYSDTSFLALIPSEGVDKQVLIRDVEGAFAVCQRTAQQYVNDACRLRRRMVNGKLSRVALLSTAERPRKEVYPGERGNRPVVWVKRINDEP